MSIAETYTNNPLLSFDWDQLAIAQFQWVEDMGWHNKTPLEAIALIASEVSEVTAEIHPHGPTHLLGEELADIVLRTVDFAKVQSFQMNSTMNSIAYQEGTVDEQLIRMWLQIGPWANSARKKTMDESVRLEMCKFLAITRDVAIAAGIDLAKEVSAKMAKNLQRGTRGRII